MSKITGANGGERRDKTVKKGKLAKGNAALPQET
jgi:hypothetical protein